MFIFKLFLLASVSVLGYVLFFKARLVLIQRLFALALAGALLVLILFPDWSTLAAHRFGVGRGVDFVFYLANLFWAYCIVRLYRMFQQLQSQLTRLTSLLARANARRPEGSGRQSGPETPKQL